MSHPRHPLRPLALLVAAAPCWASPLPQAPDAGEPAPSAPEPRPDEGAAQDARAAAPAQPAGPAQRWVALSELIGAEAALAEQEPQPGPACRVRDLLLDPRSGAVSWALVACPQGEERGAGEELAAGEEPAASPAVAVPARRLRWNAVARLLELRITRAQLERGPTLDPTRVEDDDDLSEAVEVLEAAWSEGGVEPRPAGGAPEDEAQAPASEVLVFEGLSARRTTEPCVLASELGSYPVMARARRFGGLDDALLDVRELRLDFAVVSSARRGGEVLLPFAELTVCEDLDQGQRLLCVDRSTARLEQGPQYERRADGSIDIDALRRASEAP